MRGWLSAVLVLMLAWPVWAQYSGGGAGAAAAGPPGSHQGQGTPSMTASTAASGNPGVNESPGSQGGDQTASPTRSNAGAAGFAAIVVVVGVVMFGLGAGWGGRRKLESLAVLQPAPQQPVVSTTPEQPQPDERLVEEAKARREEAVALQRQVMELQRQADEKWKEAGLLQTQVERPAERVIPGPADGPPRMQQG